MKKKEKITQKENKRFKWEYFIFLVALISSGLFFLAPGHPTTGDVWPHLVRQKIIYQAIKERFSPFFTFYFYSGYPHLQFYSPLFFFITGIFNFLTLGQLIISLKIVVFILHILSGLTIFYYLKQENKNRLAVIIGSIAFLVSPWRVLYIASFGNYPLSLIYFFLPLAFLYLDKSFLEKKIRNFIIFGFLLSFIFLTHLFYAFYTFIFILLYFVFKKYKLLPHIVYSFLSFFLPSAFFLVPFIVEYKIYLYPQAELNLPPPNPFVLLGLKSEIGGYTGTYLGWSIIILAIIGVIFLGFRNLKTISWLLALLLTFLTPFLEKYFSFLTAGLPPQRFLVYFVFFSALLVPYGFQYLIQKFKIGEKFLFLFLSVLILIDTLPSFIHLRYAEKENFLAVREEIYNLLVFQKVFKVLDIDIPDSKIDNFRRLCRYPACNFLYGNLASPLGPPYHQFAPKNLLYGYPWIKLVASDLSDTTKHYFKENSLKVLSLLGVSHIITLPTLLGSKEEETYVLLKSGVSWDDRFILAGAQPPLVYGETKLPIILASNVKKPFLKEKFIQEGTLIIADDWQKLLNELNINYENAWINFIPVLEKDHYDSLPEKVYLKINDFSLKHNEIKIFYEQKNQGFLRIPISYYPYLKIYLDDREISFYETKDHFVYIKSDSGKHILKVIFSLPPLRKFTLILSLLAFIIFLILTILVKK
uniref:Membrane protein 6-pyruvoyl-tetrahydropterin synthase-related domain-containing protein n=1 Tax=candidate division WOR-3 bacterium TaxID=2052148 RepID=A0A7V3ZVH7_UNCW3